MNPIYTVMESSHRWSILAAISFGLGCIGAMWMLALGWAHPVVLVWLLAGIVGALYFLVRGFLQWRAEVERAAQQAGLWENEPS